ncbi:putative LOC107380621-like protein [Nothobranchius furzeri]|uniref:LOC107380621-like protein n=1 Tax=Nothobranchius furzeri TaxID=105023 RepID=A0A9D2YE54_NOTFU|nr:putative LOC107380621-like protein [Nothobranchius furzeri]
MNKAEAISSETACFSDYDLSKLVIVSPLFKTLQEIQQALQNLTKDELQQHLHSAHVEHSTQENHNGQVIPAALDTLSPHHSAVFLFGSQVMQLLADCPRFPSVLLLLAKSFPFSSDPVESLLAHCSGDFYFDATNQILYLSEAKLQHVGHFIAIILQSMAYITAGSKPQGFMSALHEAISTLSLQLFNLSFKWSTAESNFDALEGWDGALAEQFLNIRVPSEARFAEQLLARRLQKYKYFKLEDLISNLKQSSTSDLNAGKVIQL